MLRTAEQFLQRRPPGGPSCLIVDVSLPGISGLDFQQQLKKTGLQLPIPRVLCRRCGRIGRCGRTPRRINSSASCAHERIEPLPFRAVLLESAPFPESTDPQRRAVEMLGGVWERAEFGNDTSACSAQIGGIPLPVQAAGLLVALTRKVRRLQRLFLEWQMNTARSLAQLHAGAVVHDRTQPSGHL